ncbi:hypothetical protein D9M73_213580 [compost metagenome]
MGAKGSILRAIAPDDGFGFGRVEKGGDIGIHQHHSGDAPVLRGQQMGDEAAIRVRDQDYRALHRAAIQSAP